MIADVVEICISVHAVFNKWFKILSSFSAEALVAIKAIKLQGFRKGKACPGWGGGLGTVAQTGSALGISCWEVRQWQQCRRG